MPRNAVEVAMPSGGHASSGPPKDPNSLKSQRIGYSPTTLPSEGYTGDIPHFPLPRVTEIEEREQQLWAMVWRTPQAAAWIGQRWRWHSIALYVRHLRVCESPDATASDRTVLIRMQDQIGLSPAGLQYNGWKVASNQLAEREKPAEAAPAARPASARDRLKALDGGKTA